MGHRHSERPGFPARGAKGRCMRKPKYRVASKNANRHTARGMATLATSIGTDGWIGAMTMAADGEAIAGSARLETVGHVMPDVEPLEIHSDGKRPIIVIRDDIPNAADPKAQRLALADNRIQELDWNPDYSVLTEMPEDVLEGLYTAEELSDVGQAWAKDAEQGGAGRGAQDPDEAPEFREYDESVADEVEMCTCPKCGHSFPL